MWVHCPGALLHASSGLPCAGQWLAGRTQRRERQGHGSQPCCDNGLWPGHPQGAISECGKGFPWWLPRGGTQGLRGPRAGGTFLLCSGHSGLLFLLGSLLQTGPKPGVRGAKAGSPHTGSPETAWEEGEEGLGKGAGKEAGPAAFREPSCDRSKYGILTCPQRLLPVNNAPGSQWADLAKSPRAGAGLGGCGGWETREQS